MVQPGETGELIQPKGPGDGTSRRNRRVSKPGGTGELVKSGGTGELVKPGETGKLVKL